MSFGISFVVEFYIILNWRINDGEMWEMNGENAYFPEMWGLIMWQ